MYGTCVAEAYWTKASNRLAALLIVQINIAVKWLHIKGIAIEIKINAHWHKKNADPEKR